jgi:hypothetical protein
MLCSFTPTFLLASFSYYCKQPCKPSLGHKLRTKLSFPKLPQHSNITSSLIESPSVTPSHSYPASFSGCGYAHPYSAFHEERSITPEEDPFRKDEVAQTPLSTPRLPNSSPRSASFYDDSEAYRHVPASCSVPALSSRWSSDSESSPSPKHARVGHPDRPVLRASPFQGPSTSLTFPLPPSTHKSLPLHGVTVRVATPTPGPPPAYPPPPTPPPFGPLPCLPPAGTITASRVRPSGRLPKESSRRRSRRDSAKSISKSTSNGQVRRRRSHLRVDMSSPSFASRPMPAKSHLEEHLSNSAPWSHEKPTTRRRERPSSPFPLPLLPMRARRDPTGRLEALKATTRFADPWKESIIRQFDQSADTISDSEVEPDRDFDVSVHWFYHTENLVLSLVHLICSIQSDKARKKISVSSAMSGQSGLSSISTTSTYTTSSSASMVTTLTTATTISPSASPHMSPDKPNNISQMLITDGIVSPSSWQAEASPSSTKSPARSAGIYTKRGGALAAHEPQGDLFLVDGEEAIIGASGWAEFRSYGDARGDVSFRLAGSLYGNGIADVLIIEFQRDGKTCGVELLLIPRTPSADFPGRIPGSYPLPSPDLPLSLRSVPRTFPVEIPQIAWNGSVLGLEDVAPPCDASRVTLLGRSLRELNHLDCTQDSGVQRSAALTFVVPLPITLRDLAKRAREMDLLDGVVTPQENSSHF